MIKFDENNQEHIDKLAKLKEQYPDLPESLLKSSFELGRIDLALGTENLEVGDEIIINKVSDDFNEFIDDDGKARNFLSVSHNCGTLSINTLISTNKVQKHFGKETDVTFELGIKSFNDLQKTYKDILSLPRKELDAANVINATLQGKKLKVVAIAEKCLVKGYERKYYLFARV